MGGFSHCFYHCAQTLFQLIIWIYKRKVLHPRTPPIALTFYEHKKLGKRREFPVSPKRQRTSGNSLSVGYSHTNAVKRKNLGHSLQQGNWCQQPQGFIFISVVQIKKEERDVLVRCCCDVSLSSLLIRVCFSSSLWLWLE